MPEVELVSVPRDGSIVHVCPHLVEAGRFALTDPPCHRHGAERRTSYRVLTARTADGTLKAFACWTDYL